MTRAARLPWAGKALILQLQCNAIDWNSVAEFWANERGCLAEEVAPGILAAAMVGGWSGERAAQEPVDPGVCEDGLEKWRCPEPGASSAPANPRPLPSASPSHGPLFRFLLTFICTPVFLPGRSRPLRVSFVLAVQDDGEADEDTSDAEQTADGVHAVWSHGAQDYGDASVHSETEKDEAFPGSPYASDIVHSPRQPGTPGIALSRASSIPPVAGMGLPALYTASSISAASVGIGGYDMFPLHGIHTTLPGIHTTAAGSAAYGPPGGCANVDAPGAFMLGGSAVGFSSLSTVGFSAPPAAGTGTTGTAVLQGSSFSALPGTYNASPWRSRPVASVAGDGFEELSLDMWSDSLKDSLWQCGQV